MTDTCTVGVADVRLVADAVSVATRAYGSFLGNVPGWGGVIEACGRMQTAADQAAIGEDLLPSADAGAIALHEQMLAFERCGFERSEAFALTHSLAQAQFAAAATKGMIRG